MPTPRLLFSLPLVALLALPAAVRADDAPAATDAAAGFKGVEDILAELQHTPREQRKPLVEKLYAACAAFLDAHTQDSTDEQFERVAGIWLSVASQNHDQAAIDARIPKLKERKNLPPKLAQFIVVQEAKKTIKVGLPAPHWTGATDIHDGTPVSLEGFKGKLVLMDFWATWCGPCIRLMKTKLGPLYERYKADERLVVLSMGVSWNGDTAQKQVDTAEKLGLHWKKAFDADSSIAASFGIEGIPFVCLIDGDGKILAVGNGFEVFADVERILGERLGAKGE